MNTYMVSQNGTFYAIRAHHSIVKRFIFADGIQSMVIKSTPKLREQAKRGSIATFRILSDGKTLGYL
jgi:hypothetical protein